MLADAKKSDDGKCRILSFRGGGVHGAYEVGALRAILEGMPSDEVMYDYVGGVSVGALNAAIFATTEPGKEQEAVDMLEDYIIGHDSSEYYDMRPNKFVAPFVHDSSADN